MKVLGLQAEWAVFRDMWRDLNFERTVCRNYIQNMIKTAKA